MKLQLLTVLLIGGLNLSGLTQEPDYRTGDVQVVRDEKVDLLLSKHAQINRNRQTMDGYRIQIFFDSGNNSKTKALSVFGTFKERFPGVGAYLTFNAPNYKVRVGDFATRLDALRFLNEILPQYPNAWVTTDKITPPQLDPLNPQP